MVEFFRKFENRSIKIARVNLILFAKPINLQFILILYCGVRCDVNSFKLTASAQPISREVYAWTI